MSLRAWEWITLAYFTYLAVAALRLAVPGPRRRRVAAVVTVVIVSVLGLSWSSGQAVVLRDWAPVVYLLLGYWLPALLVTRTNEAFERTLRDFDRRWLGRFAGSGHAFVPGAGSAVLELAYLFCYPMVPAGFALLYAAGFGEEADRFWTAVLLAVFSCYGVLPWLPTRPPRSLEAPGGPAEPDGAIRRLNLQVLGRASIQLNTFPSGHTAAALATALAVGARLPAAGAAFGILAFGIAAGSVAGRYHYLADVLSAAAVALAAFAASRLVT